MVLLRVEGRVYVVTESVEKEGWREGLFFYREWREGGNVYAVIESGGKEGGFMLLLSQRVYAVTEN